MLRSGNRSYRSTWTTTAEVVRFQTFHLRWFKGEGVIIGTGTLLRDISTAWARSLQPVTGAPRSKPHRIRRRSSSLRVACPSCETCDSFAWAEVPSSAAPAAPAARCAALRCAILPPGAARRRSRDQPPATPTAARPADRKQASTFTRRADADESRCIDQPAGNKCRESTPHQRSTCAR